MREMVSHGLRYHVRKRCERLCVRKMRKEGCFDKEKEKVTTSNKGQNDMKETISTECHEDLQ